MQQDVHFDANALINFWERCCDKLRSVIGVQPKYAVATTWDKEIEDILVFAKMFYVGKTSKGKEKPFNDLVDRLIAVFKVVSCVK